MPFFWHRIRSQQNIPRYITSARIWSIHTKLGNNNNLRIARKSLQSPNRIIFVHCLFHNILYYEYNVYMSVYLTQTSSLIVFETIEIMTFLNYYHRLIFIIGGDWITFFFDFDISSPSLWLCRWVVLLAMSSSLEGVENMWIVMNQFLYFINTTSLEESELTMN